MRSATQPGELAEVDIDRARELLGDDAARSLDRLRELTKMLEDAGLIEQREGRLELTPRAIRAIGNKALSDLYRKLMKDRAGRHELERTGVGNEHAHDHKPYEFGDPFHLNVQETVKNAIWRSGAGTPVRLSPDDFEVERTEMLTRSATVLLLDVSLSMPMRDNFLPAKKVAMALHALITSQFPRDYFGLVCVRPRRPRGEARAAARDELGLRVGHQHAARAAAGPQAARPARAAPSRSSWSPTASPPPTSRAARPTSSTRRRRSRSRRRSRRSCAARATASASTPSCSTRATTCASFVEQMMRVNGGRAFFTNADTLGDYVLVDFLDHRRQHRRAG